MARYQDGREVGREVSKDDEGKQREDNRLNDMGMLGNKRKRLNWIGHCPTYTRAGGWSSLERSDEPTVKTTDMGVAIGGGSADDDARGAADTVGGGGGGGNNRKRLEAN
ncbi:uncharacterized protein N7483_003370 [Penicillium malachiteum]|uniref:uncharacterized protein n=1 Tax=Penicillium malachiteum TaxID=1324776 RepID=UPI0025494A16|nr:uncharacterized protein N7483_003370 [Penicillium malachiteum]KAJ5728862.1 hypothetical protein N7483_003370 [Penicillium malachiteum]